MFGYITICKDELKIKEYNRYRAYYCGVCKTIGKSYNQLMRLGLSYDLTFLALLMDSMVSDKCEVVTGRCLKHIGSKRLFVQNSKALLYCADLNVLLMGCKLVDDIKDGFSPKAMLLYLAYALPMHKAKKRQPYLAQRIKKHLHELSRVEKSKTDNMDEAAHHFAQLLEDIFAGNDEFRRLGYNLGRYIYIIDALDDYKKDLKSGNYNPLVQRFGDDFLSATEFAEQSLMFTLSQAAAEYEKLEILNNKAILDNIIYLGLKQRVYAVLKGSKNEKSL